MIFSSTRQQKTDRGAEGGDRKEGIWGKEEEKRKEMSKWKKMGKVGDGWRSERMEDKRSAGHLCHKTY